MQLITYTGQGEVIVTSAGFENAAIKLYFTDGDRDLDDYDRVLHPADEGLFIEVEARIRVSQLS